MTGKSWRKCENAWRMAKAGKDSSSESYRTWRIKRFTRKGTKRAITITKKKSTGEIKRGNTIIVNSRAFVPLLSELYSNVASRDSAQENFKQISTVPSKCFDHSRNLPSRLRFIIKGMISHVLRFRNRNGHYFNREIYVVNSHTLDALFFYLTPSYFMHPPAHKTSFYFKRQHKSFILVKRSDGHQVSLPFSLLSKKHSRVFYFRTRVIMKRASTMKLCASRMSHKNE